MNVEASGNQLLSNNVFYPLGAQNLLVKTDSFPLTRTKCLSGLWLTVYHVQLTAQTWQVENTLQMSVWMITFRLFVIVQKTFEMARRRNDSVGKGSKSHQTCSSWTFGFGPLSRRSAIPKLFLPTVTLGFRQFSSGLACVGIADLRDSGPKSNFLPSVSEKRLVTVNVEDSGNLLVSNNVFYPLGAQILFGENWQFSINSYEFNVRPLTDTVSSSIDGHDMTCCKTIADLCLNGYFETRLTLLENPLKWLAEVMSKLLKAPNLIRLVQLELFYQLFVKRDLLHWILRSQTTTEWVFLFFTYLVPRNCFVKTDSFPLTRTKSLSSLWLTVYHVQLTARTWQVENTLQLSVSMITFRPFVFVQKLFEMASRRNYSVVKGSKFHQPCSAWTFYHLSVKRDLWHWLLRPQATT